MPAPETRRFLLDARDEASGYLGRELTDSEWADAYPPAAQKLSRIIQLYGDNLPCKATQIYLCRNISGTVPERRSHSASML